MAIEFNDRRTGKILYHATTADLSVGDVVKPGAEIGHEKQDNVAYASGSFPSAYYLGHDQNYDLFEQLGKKDSPIRVYRVKPVDPEDAETSSWKHDIFTSKGMEHVPEVTSQKGFVVHSEVPNPTRAWHFHRAVGFAKSSSSAWYAAHEEHRENADGSHNSFNLREVLDAEHFPYASRDEALEKGLSSCPACRQFMKNKIINAVRDVKERYS